MKGKIVIFSAEGNVLKHTLFDANFQFCHQSCLIQTNVISYLLSITVCFSKKPKYSANYFDFVFIIFAQYFHLI